jgi:hypothetical protein
VAREATARARATLPADMDVDNQVTSTVAGDDLLAVVRIEATPGLDQEAGLAMMASSQADDDDAQGRVAARLEDRRALALDRTQQIAGLLGIPQAIDGAEGSAAWKLPSMPLPESSVPLLSSDVVFGVSLLGPKPELCVFVYPPEPGCLGPLGIGESHFPGTRIVHVTPRTVPYETAGEVAPADVEITLSVIHRNIRQLAVPYVLSIFVSGVLSVGGESLAIPCIRVVVRSKGFIPWGSSLLPSEVEGVPVDVIEGPLFLPQGYEANNAERPSDAGEVFSGTHIKVLNGKKTVKGGRGTFGAVVRDRTSGERRGLTCAHVLDPPPLTGASRINFKTLKVVREDQSVTIGISIEGWKDGYELETDPNFRFSVDCGTFSLDEASFRVSSQLNVEGLREVWKECLPFPVPTLQRFTGNRFSLIDCPVFKHGATSGITIGKVATLGIVVQNHSLSCPPRNLKLDGGYSRVFTAKCFESLFIESENPTEELFSERGDSGSLVFLQNGTIVGMIFAGSNEQASPPFYSAASHIKDVEAVLHADLVF